MPQYGKHSARLGGTLVRASGPNVRSKPQSGISPALFSSMLTSPDSNYIDASCDSVPLGFVSPLSFCYPVSSAEWASLLLSRVSSHSSHEK